MTTPAPHRAGRPGGLVDIHAHVLPGVDDGAPDLAASVEMLDAWEHLGVTTVVATPHLKRPLDPEYAARVREAFAAVLPEAQRRGIELIAGFEVLIGPDLPARLQRGEGSGFAGCRGILVETPFSAWPPGAEETIFGLQVGDYRPVLAHPERYAIVQRDIAFAFDLASRGIALQVSAGSLVGRYGAQAEQVARKLVRARAVTLLASDAHRAGRDLDLYAEGIAWVAAELGDTEVTRLCSDAPRRLLDGRAFAPVPDLEARPARGLRRLFRRD